MLEQTQGLDTGRLEILRVLKHGEGPVVIDPTQQDLAEETKCLAESAVDLDDLDQLGLRLFPLMETHKCPRQRDAPLDEVGIGLEPAHGNLDGVAGTAQRHVGVAEIDEQR